MNRQYGFYLDADSCTGCNACAIACKDKNNLPMGILWRQVNEIEDRSNGYIFYITMSCNHCKNPSCVEACCFGALEKRDMDGLVAVNIEKCRGCRKCIISCPYGSLHINKDNGKIGKCDGCLDLKNNGEAPECVSACPMRAIEFGAIEELLSRHLDAVPIDLIIQKGKSTLPSFIVKTRKVRTC